jgi:hypothetical protein
MKKLITVLIILFSTHNIFAQSSFTNNFPLKIGNIFIFKKYSFGCCPPGSSTVYKKSIVTKDTLIDSKKYFFIDGYYSFYTNKWWRMDSATGVISFYDTTVVCSQSYHERKIDSLWSNVGDSIKACDWTGFICNNVSTTTIFNTNKPSKKFIYPSFGTTFTKVYCQDFGLTFCAYAGGRAPYYGGEEYQLMGCIIGGILYGDTNTVGINILFLNVPVNITLSQNYPNPFNPSTVIRYRLSAAGIVSLKVFDLLGKEVASLVNEKQSAGSYAVDFNSAEYNLPSGIYFYTLNAGEFKETKKMVLIK